MTRLLCLFSLLFICYGCWDIKKGAPIDAFAPGIWRGKFHLPQQDVPVLYDVQNTDNERPITFVFSTADQQIVSDTAYYFGDTLYAYFDDAQTYLCATYQIDQMDGFLYDQNEKEYPIRFSGIKGPKHRFPNIREEPVLNLTGEWTIAAKGDTDTTITASLRLAAQTNTVTGRLQFQGQSHILEGTVQGNKLYLSGFDGRQVVWINALIFPPNRLDKGSIRLNETIYYLEAQSSAGIETVE